MRFQLNITLGDDAMTSPWHLGQALREVADRMNFVGELAPGEEGFIHDANGNGVGSWFVEADE